MTPQEQEAALAEAKKEYTIQKEQTIAKAKEMGIPLVVKEKDGSVSRLRRFTEDGQPIYFSTFNAGSARTSRANRVYPGGAAGLSLTGAGIKGGIWDEGKVLATHTTFSGRVEIMETNGTELSLHSTHVAGTVIGNGGNTPTAKGIAYQGFLYSDDWDNDSYEMRALADQIITSCHSYGLRGDRVSNMSIFGKYDSTAREVDRITYDFPYYQPVIAAGNDRNSGINPTKFGYDLLSQFGVAKNTLTVAAVQQVYDYSTIEPNQVVLASFTNFGPTDDYRIKPNIATKGVAVYSSSSAGNNEYAMESGTSMAAPGITGVIMLLQQHFSNLHPSDNPEQPNYMLSASVRGLLSHTADEIGDEEGPDVMTGWGLVNAEASASVLSRAKENSSTVVFDERTLSQGGTYEIQVLADDSAKMAASISWTDPAGAVANGTTDSATPTLVNNLDLRVTNSSSEVYFPWGVNPSFGNPYIVQANNDADNFEKVDVSDASGLYTITVSHKGTLTGGSQDYTLIVTGISQVNSVKKLTADDLMVWPNPSAGFVNVQLAESSFSDDAVITVFDVQGREVLSRKAASSVERIDTSSFNSGVYFLKLNNAGKQQVKKFIVK
nr:S8 family serine peptidase [uncultured Flavobacterium sp.]